MPSLVNELELNGNGYQSHQQQGSHNTQTHGTPSLDSDLLSDPSRLISLVINGTDNHGISSSRRQERRGAYSSLSQGELLDKLIDKEYEAKRLVKVLRAALQRLNSQTARISELERDSQEALERVRQINESRVQAQQLASSTEQELQLYRSQFEDARQELVRGQNMIATLRQQRDEAEQAAARARARARKLRHQRLVDAAREEGRRWGFHDGFERAREVLTTVGRAPEALPLESGPTQSAADAHVQDVENEEAIGDAASARSSASEIMQQTEVRPPSVRSGSTVHRNNVDGSNDPPLPSLAPQPQIQQTEPPPRVATPSEAQADVQTAPQPMLQTPSVFNEIKSPAISVFQVDFADAQQELGERYNDDRDQNLKKPPTRSWVTASQYNRLHDSLPFQRRNVERHDPPPNQSRAVILQTSQINPQDEKKKLSWYRTFSFRKKFGKRREIDPDPTEDPEVSTAGQSLTAAEDEDEHEMYRHRRPSMSWYQPKGSSLHAASSRHRRGSVGSGSTSTHMSQLPLVNTPSLIFAQDINASNPSLSGRSAKESGIVKKIKEKESLLSVIKEDPMSRETTPMAERTFGGNRSKTPVMSHFGSSSSMNSQAMGGPLHSIRAALTDPRYSQFPLSRPNLGQQRRSVSEATPPVTIEVETPSRSPSEQQRIEEELPNRFLSPSLTSKRLPQSPTIRRPSIDVSRAQESPDKQLSRQTSAMHIKESYLARAAAEESTSQTQSPSGSFQNQARLPPRQSTSRPSPAGPMPGSPIGPMLLHQQSSVSLRSMGSYSKFDPSTYVDPAFYEPNAVPNTAPRDTPRRPASSISHLSYVTDKR